MRVAFHRVDGRRVRVLSAGAPAATAIVLVHGIGTLAERWLRNLDDLGQSAQVLAPDLWSNGFSDELRPGDGAPPLAHVEQLSGLLDVCGIQRCVMVGSSYGGQVAGLMALTHPQRVAALAIVGSGSALHDPETQLPVLQAVKANALKAIDDGTAESVRARLRSTSFSEAGVIEEMVLPLLTANASPGRREASVEFFDGLLACATDPVCMVQPRLEQLQMPVMFISGREDIRANWRFAVKANDRVAGSQLHLFEQCGHGPMAEHPARFNALIRQFAEANLFGSPS